MWCESCQPYALPSFTPGLCSWYSFLLDSAEPNPGPLYHRKDYINEKFKWHERESNQRHYVLYRSTLTNLLALPPIHGAQNIIYIWSLWFCHQNLCVLSVHGLLKATLQRLYSDHMETQLYLQLGASRKWQNVQQFLKQSSTMFNVDWIVKEAVFPCNVSIILVKQNYYTWYCNCLISWLVYIKSSSQDNFRVLLYKE